MDIMQLVKGAVPPGLLALVLFALLWRRAGTVVGAGDGARLWWAPAIFTIAYIPTHLLVLGRTWPPITAFDWLPVIAVAALGMSLVLAARRVPGAARWLAAAAGLGLVGWLTAKNLIANRWSAGETALHLGVFILVSLGAALGAMALARDRRGPAVILVLMLPVVAASQLLTVAYYSVRLGQAAGVTAAVLGAALAVSIWRRQLVLGAGGAAWVMLFTVVAMFQGVAGEDPGMLMIYPLAVAAAPALALGARRLMARRAGRGGRLGPAPGLIVEVAAAGAPLAAAVAVAIAKRAAAGNL